MPRFVSSKLVLISSLNLISGIVLPGRWTDQFLASCFKGILFLLQRNMLDKYILYSVFSRTDTPRLVLFFLEPAGFFLLCSSKENFLLSFIFEGCVAYKASEKTGNKKVCPHGWHIGLTVKEHFWFFIGFYTWMMWDTVLCSCAPVLYNSILLI